MGKTELITIAITFIFTIAVLVCIPMWLKDGDYILLAFISVSCLISIYNCWLFVKKDRDDNNGNN